MAKVIDLYTIDTLKEEGIVGVYSSALGLLQATPVSEVREYLGAYQNPTMATTSTLTEGTKFHDCVSLATTSARIPEFSFDFFAEKNAATMLKMFGETAAVINLGILTPVVGELATVKKSVDDGVFLVPVRNIDYANEIVQALVVKDTQAIPVVFVQGVDYEITRLNGYTAIITLTGGGITDGLDIQFDYSYTPYIDYSWTIGTGDFLLSSMKWFIRTNTNGVDLADQDKIIDITFNDAEVTSEVSFAWLSCDNADAGIIGLPITITNKDGEGVVIKHIQR